MSRATSCDRFPEIAQSLQRQFGLPQLHGKIRLGSRAVQPSAGECASVAVSFARASIAVIAIGLKVVKNASITVDRIVATLRSLNLVIVESIHVVDPVRIVREPLTERLASDFRYSRAREIVKSRSSCCHRAQVSKIVDDEKNGLIGAVRHDRRGPTGAAHGQYSTNTIRQFKHEIRNRSCTKNEAPEPQLRGSQTQPSTSARYGVRLSYALVDAAMPPISRAGLFRAREIWIDDALCRAARCRRIALRQRRVAALVIVEPPSPYLRRQTG
jgi:hypothetical protein